MAKEIKPGFITTKHKEWGKLFDENNLGIIWEFFMEHFNSVRGTNIDWTEELYTTHIKGISRIPVYPETDRWDDSEGIQPRQVSKIIDLLGFEGFKKIMVILSKNVGMFVNNDDYFYTEGENRNTTIISWKKVVKEIILPKVKSKDIAYFGKIIFSDAVGATRLVETYTTQQFPYAIDDDIFKSIIVDELELEKILFYKTNKLYESSTVLNLKNLNADDFFKNRESEWMKIHKIIPKNKELLLLDPEFWDKKIFLDSMERLYKTKNLNSLSSEDQQDFINFYKSFGQALLFVAPMINNEKISKPSPSWPVLYKNNIPDGLKKILSNASRGIDIRLKVSDILHIYLTMSQFKDSNEFILKRNRITVDDVNQLMDVGTNLKGMTFSDLKGLKNIPWRHIGVFKKYNVHNTESVLKLYSSTKDNKLNIPTVSGDIGQYKYEILPKNDIRGLVAGNATNCCQHIPTGIGKSCVYYGAENKDSAFFIITDRAGTIVCQSWLWCNKNILVCDSAEAVRRDALFYDAYLEMAEKVVQESDHISEVRIGSYGRAFDKALPDTDNVSVPSIPSNSKFDYGRNGSLYSDAAGYQKLLYKK